MLFFSNNDDKEMKFGLFDSADNSEYNGVGVVEIP